MFDNFSCFQHLVFARQKQTQFVLC